MLLNIPDILIFFGRFHPLVVHLPIGILILAAVIALLSRKEKFRFLSVALDFVLLLGAISAAFACVLGYLLSLGGDYNEDSLFWHQWGGISLAVLSFGIYWVRNSRKYKIPEYITQNTHFGFWMILVLITLTGHMGGNLTHGSEYLFQYAPDPVRTIAGLGPKPIPRPPVTNLDSADIFLDVVQPLVESKCQTCHNKDKVKGELLLTDYQVMLKGGKNGPGIVPGDPEKSVFYQRVTLPKSHKEYMPAEGKQGFDDDEIALIKWWIEQEAPPTMLLASMQPENEIKTKFERVLGISTSDNRLPNIEVATADSAAVAQAREAGFIIKRITPGSSFLEVRLTYNRQNSQDIDFQALLPIKDQITWMDLSRGELKDKDLETVGQLKHLSRLNISNNSLTDEGIAQLQNLEELRYLNLYGTQVTDLGLSTLKELKKLQSVYLWQTKVTQSGLETLQKERPGILVTLGNQELPEEEQEVES